LVASYDDDGLISCPSVGTIIGSKVKVCQVAVYENMRQSSVEGNVVQFDADDFTLEHFVTENIYEIWQNQDDQDKQYLGQVDFEWVEVNSLSEHCCRLII
jgi:hypothetical protein